MSWDWKQWVAWMTMIAGYLIAAFLLGRGMPPPPPAPPQVPPAPPQVPPAPPQVPPAPPQVPPAPPQVPPGPKPVALRDAVLRLSIGNAGCSGAWIVAAEPRVLCAAHCAVQATAVAELPRAGLRWRLSLVYRDRDHDVSLWRLSQGDPPPPQYVFRLREDHPAPGEPVYQAGWGVATGNRQYAGQLVSCQHGWAKVRLHVSNGDSGGPIVDREGRVVSVVCCSVDGLLEGVCVPDVLDMLGGHVAGRTCWPLVPDLPGVVSPVRLAE
jgi:hypothetical protein